MKKERRNKEAQTITNNPSKQEETLKNNKDIGRNKAIY